MSKYWKYDDAEGRPEVITECYGVFQHHLREATIEACRCGRLI